jgi:pentatricopeptide repeat protein
VFLSSCATLTPLERDGLAEIDKLHTQFRHSKNNPLYHMKLGAEYEKLASESSSITYMNKAIASYSDALKLDPDNTSLKFSLYQLLYAALISGHAEISALKDMYESLDEPIRKSLNPPHLAVFQQQIALIELGRVTEKELEETVYKAFEENPFSPMVCILLSNFWIDQKRFVLSIDILKRSLALYPDNPKLHAQLGDAYDAYASRNACPYEHPAEIRKSLGFLQKAIQKAPDMGYVNHTLAIQYQRLNTPFLTVEAAKKLVASNSSHSNRLVLAEALSNAGQLEKAEEIYEELLREGIRYAYIEQAMVNAEHGNWQRSYELTRRFLEHKRRGELPIYSALLYLSVEALLDAQPTSLDELSYHVATNDLSQWEKALLGYWYEERSESEVLALADNLCKKAELNFLSGIKKVRQKDHAAADHYFKAVLDSNTYSFTEYRITEHLRSSGGG